MRRTAYAVVVALLLTGCGSGSESVVEQPEGGASSSVVEQPEERGRSVETTPQPTSPPVVEPGEGTSSSVVEQPEERGRSVETTPAPRARLSGIDVSHHQGAIDWLAVADDDIDFAYLKATEGSSFTDDRFVTNARSARSAGLEVGGYHYYTLCAAPEAQADHFAETLARVRTTLPPVVDLELLGNCDPPPDRATLLAQVRVFIDRVEQATDRRVVVYFHPDFEAHYAMVDELDRRLWVRRVGSQPPKGDWFIWQRDDAGTVAGVGTPVDVDVMRR